MTQILEKIIVYLEPLTFFFFHVLYYKSTSA